MARRVYKSAGWKCSRANCTSSFADAKEKPMIQQPQEQPSAPGAEENLDNQGGLETAPPAATVGSALPAALPETTQKQRGRPFERGKAAIRRGAPKAREIELR